MPSEKPYTVEQAGLAPVGEIGPQPWLTAPETKAVLAALTREGQEARFVGGCVRDAVARRPVEDVDIATPDPPETVMALLTSAGIKVVPTGLSHGTVTAVIGGRTFEITTLREDVETFGRHARVAFVGDWIADARRRDFTINALSCTPAGRVYDPFEGLYDLAHGRVRFVGRARDRIEEDVLRLLRFFRFYATYGRPPADRDALAACRALAHRLPELSGERVREEMFRILLAPDPASVALLMRGERVLVHVLPEAGDVGTLRAVAWLAARGLPGGTVAPDPVRRLAALLDIDPAGAERVADRLRFSNRDRERLVALMEPVAIGPETDAAGRERLLRRHGVGLFRDAVLLAWAKELARAPRLSAARTEAWRELLAAARPPKEFPLRGRDVLALGVPPGPQVGELLAEVEAWWEEGGCTAGREACLEKLKAQIAKGV